MTGGHYGHESVDTYAARRRANEASKAWAVNDHGKWTTDDDDVLMEYWILVPPSERDEVEVSKALGRTIESCRVRCEHVRKARGISNVVVEQRRTVVEVKGWLVGYCFGCGRLTDVFSDGVTSKCEDCR